MKQLNIAVLGDTSTQFLCLALRGLGFEYGFNFQVWESDFDQVEQQVTDPGSELYASKPGIIIVFQSSHKLLSAFNKLNPEERILLAKKRIELVSSLYESVKANSGAKLIYYNYNEIDDTVFGNYATKTKASFLYQLRLLNVELMQFAVTHPDFFLCDLSSIQNQHGKSILFNPAVYVNTEMVLAIDLVPFVAARTIDIIAALSGNFKKCLILDLDNTLWGGVIGDDGIENIEIGNLGIGKAFSEFQHWVKKMKERGIILAVCSKNTESIAREPFEKHPDMVLKLDDIAVFVANWETKVDNIRYIKEILNIGFDSMVFLDDNPFERNMVRENIPGIIVPELPDDPAEYLEYIYRQNLFETVSVSQEDAERTKLYQEEALRTQVQKKFTNEDDFLQSLEMSSKIESFTKFNTPRVAQLSQRSNQFNLRTVRYSEADIEKMSADASYFPFSFTLSDKFGDNGLICVIILKQESSETAFIDTWFMSCRVLKRGMEHFTLNTIANFAKQKGFTQLKGEYIPTPKNEMVQNHFEKLGFIKQQQHWFLDLKNYTDKKNFITPDYNGQN